MEHKKKRTGDTSEVEDGAYPPAQKCKNSLDIIINN